MRTIYSGLLMLCLAIGVSQLSQGAFSISDVLVGTARASVERSSSSVVGTSLTEHTVSGSRATLLLTEAYLQSYAAAQWTVMQYREAIFSDAAIQTAEGPSTGMPDTFGMAPPIVVERTSSDWSDEPQTVNVMASSGIDWLQSASMNLSGLLMLAIAVAAVALLAAIYRVRTRAQ